MRGTHVHSRRWKSREPRCATKGSPCSGAGSCATALAVSGATGSSSEGSGVVTGSAATVGAGSRGGRRGGAARSEGSAAAYGALFRRREEGGARPLRAASCCPPVACRQDAFGAIAPLVPPNEGDPP